MTFFVVPYYVRVETPETPLGPALYKMGTWIGVQKPSVSLVFYSVLEHFGTFSSYFMVITGVALYIKGDHGSGLISQESWGPLDTFGPI